jgi:hypothetical protein
MSHTADLGSFVAQQEGDLSPGAPLAQSDHDSPVTVAGAIEENRTAERRLPSEVAADIRFGIRVVADARPIDISQTGILSETTTRLRPGSAVELVLHIDGEQHMLRATVVRSSVYSLNPTVFRTAFNFDQPTTLSEPE